MLAQRAARVHPACKQGQRNHELIGQVRPHRVRVRQIRQHILRKLACDLLGVQSTLDPDPTDAERMTWHSAFIGAPAITIGAGTTEVQTEELGSRLLGL